MREEQSCSPAQQSQQRAFNQQLPDYAKAARANSHADRNLLLAIRPTRQQQIGEVRAGDQQHATNHAPKREQSRPKVSDYHLTERMDTHLRGFLEARHDGAQFPLRALVGYPWLKTRYRFEPMSEIGVRTTQFLGAESPRYQHVGLCKEIEAWRDNPNDGVTLPLKRHGLPNQIRVGAPAALPQAMADEDDLIKPRLEFFGRKWAPRIRTNAK